MKLGGVINIYVSSWSYVPTYQILMISDNVEFLWYCGGHFENGRHLENFENACPQQISGTTGQNFMKLGGVINIYVSSWS
jgi:hypothetical protein